MNEFNPFEALGIDPNKEIQTSWPTLRVDNDSNQFNPFTTLWINPNKTQIDQTWMQIYDNIKDNEVSSKLGVDLTPLSDPEKQSYVDALSNDDWNIWNNLKNEWYSFEARKALLENKESLYDINKAWTQKYFTEYIPVEDKYDVAQNIVNWYQNRAQWFWDRMEENVSEFLNYKKDGTERWWYPWKKIANLVNHVVSKGAQIIDDAMNIGMQAMEVRSAIDVARWKTDKIVDFDENTENYKSVFASSIWLATWIGEATLMAVAPYVYGVFWILGQGDGPVAKLINWLAIPFELGAEWIVDLALTNDKFQEYLNRPENAWAEEELKEGVSLALMAIVWKYLKSRNEAWGKTRMGRFYTETKTKIWNAIKKGAEYAKGIREMMETDPRFSETSELIKTQNVIKATWRGLKEWRNKDVRLEETPTETVNKGEAIESKEITPYEQERQKQIQQRKTDIVNQTKDLKISDESKNNLSNNPDLQTAYTEVLKPYLQENGTNNTQWVINQQIEDLVYDIRAWIDELYTQQANLTRTVWWTQRISKLEKELIKEIKKIIANKEPKTVIKKLSKLTPAQQGIMEKILPDLNKRITTINQLDKLVQEITKNNLVWKILKFQAERPRRGIRGALKKQLYKYISDYWTKRGIQHTVEDIDKFVNSLSEAEQKDIFTKKNFSHLDPLLEKTDILMDKIWEIKKEPNPKQQEAFDDESWYMNATDAYTYDENGRLTMHKTSDEFDLKPFDSENTIRDILQAAWVKITLPNNMIFTRFFAKDPRVRWGYNSDFDFIGLPYYSSAMFMVMHELAHRIKIQLTEEERTIVENNILTRARKEMAEKGYNQSWIDKHINSDRAEERMSEFVRNYSLYWNIFGKTAKEVLTTELWQKYGQKIVNVMEKFKEELFNAFGVNWHKDLINKIDSIVKLKPKWKEILSRETSPKADPQLMLDAISKKIGEETPLNVNLQFEKLNKGLGNEEALINMIKKSTNELTNIRVDEKWNIVWDFHWHKTPVYSYIENSNIPEDIKEILKQQEEFILEEQDAAILEKLKD